MGTRPFGDLLNRLFIAAIFLVPVASWGQENKRDLTQLDLKDLMDLKVTTASKEAQSLSDVPSAVYVITQEDIRRSGAMNVPEALRLAPGVIVSQMGSNEWMISIRGFNGLF